MSSNKSLLSDFYGIALSSAGEDEPAAAVETTKPRIDERKNLESENFDPQHYLSNLLATRNMKDLIAHDNSLISSKRSLDSEMQTLVYENYNKFISATDTIRSMKRNVEEMENQMHSLASQMDTIKANSSRIESALTPNRQQVDNLLGVSRLLKRLEFLFELPGKLKKAIELGAFEQAVKYYRVSNNILAQYAHLKSFEEIRGEARQIMENLKRQLRQALKAPAAADPTSTAVGGRRTSLGHPQSAPGVPAISSEVAMSYVGMLVLDLAEPEEQANELVNDLIAQHRRAFLAGQARAVELASKGATVPATTGLSPGARKGSLASSSERKGSVAGEGEGGADGAHAGPNLLGLLHQHFVTPYLLFADTYLSTLVKPYEAKLRKLQQHQEQQQLASSEAASSGAGAGASSGGGGASTLRAATAASVAHLKKALAFVHTALITLTVELFTAYFTLARKELLARATITPTDDAQRVTLAFTAALKDFYSGLSKLLVLVPQAQLTDRATEVMEHAIRHCVDSVCDKVLTNVVQLLVQLHSDVLNFQPSSTTSALQTPQALSTQIRRHIEEGVSLLVVVLSTREYLPENVSFSFTDLAHAHFHQLLASLVNLLAYRAPRKQEGPVYDHPGPGRLGTAIAQKLGSAATQVTTPGANPATAPLFSLYLSQILSAQEAKDIPASIKALRKFFPAVTPTRGRPATLDALFPALIQQTKESAQALLIRFVETHGFAVTHIVRTHMLKHAADDVRQPSEFVDRLQQHLARISSELALLFPREAGSHTASDLGRADSSRRLGGPSGPGGRGDSKGSAGGRPGATGSSGGAAGGGAPPSIARDIARLFTQKITTFPGVDAPDAGGGGATTTPAPELTPNRTQPLWAVCKIAFKAMMEVVRLETLTESSYHQLQLDVYTLRRELNLALPDASTELCRVLHVLLDETLNSASDRAPHVQAWEEFSLADFYETARAGRPSALVAPTTPAAAASPSADSHAEAETAKHASAVSTSGGAGPSPSETTQPTGALARLVLSSPPGRRDSDSGANQQVLSPTSLLQQIHGRNTGIQP